MELFQDTGDVTGPASSTDNAIARFDSTTGKVLQNSAATVADTTGDITAGKYNGLTVSTTTGTLTIANGKTLASDNTLTFTGTDSSTVSLGAGGTVAYKSNKLSVFSSTTSSEFAGVISDETGTGALVFANTPTLVTPVLGAASATSLNNVTVTTPATSATLTLDNGSALITSGAYSVTLTATATTALTLPTSGTVTALGNSVTGSGNIVRDTSPSLTTPVLGVASATTVNKVTLTAPATGSTLTLGDGSTLSLAASKTFTVSNTLTFTGTDSSSVAFGAGGTTAYLGTQQAYSKQQYVSVGTLTDAASIAWDVTTTATGGGQKAKVTLGGNRQLAAVSGAVEGATYYLYVFQPSSGGPYTLSYTTTSSVAGTQDFGATTQPTLSTAASACDVLAFEGVSIGGFVRLRYLGIMKGFTA
jgi:hypothetical protein